MVSAELDDLMDVVVDGFVFGFARPIDLVDGIRGVVGVFDALFGAEHFGSGE